MWGDYSSYFYIKNELHVSMRYNERSAYYGEWQEDPVEIINPGETHMIHLKDKFGDKGTEGFVRYNVDLEIDGTKPLLTFTMACNYNNDDPKTGNYCNLYESYAEGLFDIHFDQVPAQNAHPVTTFYTIRYSKNLPWKVALKSITLPEPLFPVVDNDGFSRHYRRVQHPLWNSSDLSHAIPATTALGSDSVEVRLTLTVDPELIRLKPKVISTCHDVSESLKVTSKDMDISKTSGDFEVFIILHPKDARSDIPWGYKGPIDLDIVTESTGHRLSLGHAQIEIYAISRFLHPFLAIDGVPIELLQFMVLPTRTQQPPVKKFVKYVTERIHKDTGFVYDTIGGGNNYANVSETFGLGSFNLSKWLRNRRAMTMKRQYHVNCYDQAGIVGICLGFGFLDGLDATQGLQWFKMDPFGFINKTHLVGWEGDTNNPFFANNREKQFCRNLKDTDRGKFNRHVFLTWHGKVLDATCGPEIGEKDLNQYIAAVIDRGGNRGESAGSFDDIRPISTMAKISGSISESQTISDADENWSKSNADVETVVKGVKNVPEKGFNVTFYALLSDLQNRCKGYEPPYDIQGSGQPYNVTTYDKMNHNLTWAMTCTYNHQESMLDLEITVCDTHEKAGDVYKSILLGKSGSITTAPYKMKDGSTCQVIKGTNTCRFFWVYGHMFIKLSGQNIGDVALTPVVEELQGFLKNEANNTGIMDKNAPKPVAVINGIVDPVGGQKKNSFKLDTCMEIHVNVKNSVRYTWNYQYGNVLLLDVKRSKGPLDDTYTYVFRLYARNLGVETITFSFNDAQYRTAVEEFKLCIVE